MLSNPAKWDIKKLLKTWTLARKKLILKNTRPSSQPDHHPTPLTTHPIFQAKIYAGHPPAAPWFHLDHPTLNHMLQPILVVVVHQHPQSISCQVPLPNQPLVRICWNMVRGVELNELPTSCEKKHWDSMAHRFWQLNHLNYRMIQRMIRRHGDNKNK